MIDPTINLGTILAIMATIVSAAGFVWAIKGSVKVLDTRLTAQDKVIGIIRDDVAELTKAVTTLSLQQQRMDVLDERLQSQGRRFDEHVTRFDRMIDERLKASRG